MTVTMGIFRSHTTTSHPTTTSTTTTANGSILPKDPDMSSLRTQTAHLTSKFHKSPSAKNFKDEPAPEMGIPRSHTDPLDKQNSNSERTSKGGNSSSTYTNSGESSGTSSPRHSSRPSLDTFRNLRERPTSVIPGLYLAAEQVHRYKMRTCQGMHCTVEEAAEIKKMNHWTWKRAGRPGEAPLPVGPHNESWHFEGVALEQVLNGHTNGGSVERV